MKDRSITQPKVIIPYNTLPPSERRHIWGVGTVNGRTLTYRLRFSTWGTRDIYVFRDRTREYLYKETFEVMFELVSSTTSKKCEGVTY